MVKGLKFAVVSAIFLLPFTYPRSALSWDSLTYQEAVWMCNMGYPRACDVVYAYRAGMASYGRPGGSPADRWVSPQELQQGGLRGVRRGPLSTYDFVR
jgi:hypothetical protein